MRCVHPSRGGRPHLAKGFLMKHRIPMLAFLAAVALPAAAQAQGQGQEIFRQYCTGDYMRLCSQYDPDSPQVDQCFRANMTQLTPQCRTAINTYTRANPGGRRQ